MTPNREIVVRCAVAVLGPLPAGSPIEQLRLSGDIEPASGHLEGEHDRSDLACASLRGGGDVVVSPTSGRVEPRRASKLVPFGRISEDRLDLTAFEAA